MPDRRHSITIVAIALVGALLSTLLPLIAAAPKERSSGKPVSSSEQASRGKERTTAKTRAGNQEVSAGDAISHGNERTAALRLEPVATGFEQPLFVIGAETGDEQRLFVVEKPGRIRIVDAGTVLDPPFLDITGIVNDGANERGLLGLAFHNRAGTPSSLRASSQRTPHVWEVSC